MGICGAQVGQGVGFSPGGGGPAAAGNAVDGGAGAVWTPAQISGVVCWLAIHGALHRWQESIAGIAATNATANGDPVGQIDDPVSGKRWVAAGDSRRPTLVLPATGRAVGLNFAGGTSSNNTWDALYLENSAYLLGWLPTAGVGTILLTLKPAEDSNDGIILDCVNGTGSGSPVGFFCQKDSAGALQWVTYNGSGTAAVVNAKTPNGAIAAGGQRKIKLKFNGNGANHLAVNVDGVNLSMSGSTDNNFPATTVAKLTNNLYVGQLLGAASSTSGFNGEINDIAIIEGRALADDDADWLEYLNNYNPANTSATIATNRTQFLTAHWDFSAASKMFVEHNALTLGSPTQVTAGARIGTVLDYRDSAAAVRFNSGLAAAASDNTRPVYSASAVQNGLRVAEFAGTTGDPDILTLAQAIQKRGRGSAFLLVRNTNDTIGSHVLANGTTVYVTITGAGYTDNPDDFVWHFGQVGGLEGEESDNPWLDGNGPLLLDLHWDGANAWAWANGVASNMNPRAFSAGEIVNWATVAGPRTDWEWQGWGGEMKIFNDMLSAANRSAERAAFASRWGIALP